MSVESQVNNIADLNPTYPQADDPVSQGDNHIRNIKKALKDTFPNIDGTVTASEDELNQLVGQDLPSDVGALESRVSKNEGDIANNAAGIANNASAIAANTSRINDVEVIAVNNERELQDKADKTYVDSQNSAQDAVIAQKADKSYVDAQDNALSGRISSLENAGTPGLIPHGINDHTDVNTSGVKNGQALVYKDGVWVPVDILGGGSVNFMTQPTTAGDASLNPTQQTYEMTNWNNMGYATQTLTVPAGAVFIMEYFFGESPNTIRVQLNEIKIDGKPLTSVGTSMDWDSTGGPVWPGSEGFTPIVVRQSIEVRAYVGQNGGTFSIAGMFSEKS